MPEGTEVESISTDTAPELDTSIEIDGASEFESTELPTESAVEGLFEIDGTQITLDEARNGYLRQADYTRKTQELAAQRRELQVMEAVQAALERNPAEALRALAEAYQVPFGQPTPAPQQGAEDNLPWEVDETSTVDPALQARLEQVERFIQQQEQQAVLGQIETQLSELRSTFGQVDDVEIVSHALKNGFTDLRTAYADLHFNDLVALRQKASQEQQRVAAKRAAQVVQADTGKAPTVTSAPSSSQTFNSFRDAYLAAKAQLDT